MNTIAYTGASRKSDVKQAVGAGNDSDKPENSDRPRRVRSEAHKAQNRAGDRARRARLKREGLCKACMASVSPGHVYCDGCLAKRRAQRAEQKKQLMDDLLLTAQPTSGPTRTEAETPDDEGSLPSAGNATPFANQNGCAYNVKQQNGTVERSGCSTVPSLPESGSLQWLGLSVEQPIPAFKPSCLVTCPRDGEDQCPLSGTTSNACCYGKAFDSLGGMAPMTVDPRYPTKAPWPGPDDRTDSMPFVKAPGGWITPSQTDPSVYYHLSSDEDGAHCSCPDPAASCQHIRGLEVMLKRERHEQEIIASIPEAQLIRDHLPQRTFSTPPNGDAGTARPGLYVVHADTPAFDLDAPMRQVNRRSPRGPDSPARKRIAPGTEDRKRPTYQQDWSIYNPAHMNMKTHFRHLLRDLVALVEGPIHLRGRRSHSYATQIFSLVYKEYVEKSLRAFDTDLREAAYNHYVGAAPSTSALARYMDDPALTPILHDLILCSAMPMHRYETTFAIDATGFSSDRFARWFSEKWGQVVEHQAREWIKLHLICGTETGIITCADVSDWRDHDNKYFAPLVADTAEHFDMHQIAADKAYTSRTNYAQVHGFGAALLAPFKSNVVPPRADDDSAWARMLRLFLTDYDRWAAEYHVRSIAESVISKLKRLFGDELYCRNVVAQCNELLCRIIAYNLTVVVYQMYERNLVPDFHHQELMSAA